MAAFEDLKKSEVQSNSDRIFDEFCADRESVAALGITDEEFRELSRASLLGALTSTEDVLFMLKQIRKAVRPAEPPVNEQSMSDAVAMTETMRRAALAKLDQSDSQGTGPLSRAAWRRVKMMLNRRIHPSPSYRTD